MLRWRNSSKIKEQDEDTARDLSETGVGNMLDGEFKETITKILTGLQLKLIYKFID